MDDFIKKMEHELRTSSKKENMEASLEYMKEVDMIASKHDKKAVDAARDRYENRETMNYISDAELSEMEINPSLTKDKISSWLTSQGHHKEEKGLYNLNALVAMMNKEYKYHRNYISTHSDQLTVVYNMAIEPLRKWRVVE